MKNRETVVFRCPRCTYKSETPTDPGAQAKTYVTNLAHMVKHLKDSGASTRPPAAGDFVYIRYKDHVLFKDSDATLFRPWIRETVGWLDYQDNEFVRVVWERYAEP